MKLFFGGVLFIIPVAFWNVIITPMGDLKDARLMVLKAALFLAIGILASAGILVDDFSVSKLALLGLAIWAFCRLYYFCFYVVEKYIDAEFKFAGLSSVLVYLWRRR